MASAAAACKVVDRSGMSHDPRAVTMPDGNTLLEKDFWQGLAEPQRAAVVSHERAHVLIGLDCPCESCADKVGGYTMRMWGFSEPAIADAYQSLRVPRQRNLDGTYRDAAAGALEGAKTATRTAAARGLSGSASLSTILAVDKKAALSAKSSGKSTAPAAKLAAVARTLPAASIPTPSAPGSSQPVTATSLGGVAPVSAVLTPIAPAQSLSANLASATTLDPGGPGRAPVLQQQPSPIITQLPNVAGNTSTTTTANSIDTVELKTQIVAGIVVAVILAIVLGMKGG